MSIRLGRLPVRDAHLVLFAIEQNLMPGNTGKRLEYEISRNAHDALAAHIQDYDWADEVLHVHTGREWLLPRLKHETAGSCPERLGLRATTAGYVEENMKQRGEQRNWWPDFGARKCLGRGNGR